MLWLRIEPTLVFEKAGNRAETASSASVLADVDPSPGSITRNSIGDEINGAEFLRRLDDDILSSANGRLFILADIRRANA